MRWRRSNGGDATTQRAWPSRHPLLAALAVVAALIAILIAIWDWNWFKGPVERQVEARTGRTFRIGGDLDVDLGWTPVVKADRVTFGNATWSRDPVMASAQRAELAIALWPLLRGRVLLQPQARTPTLDVIPDLMWCGRPAGGPDRLRAGCSPGVSALVLIIAVCSGVSG